MTVLPAGSFRVSDYRKSIPDWVKVACAIVLIQKMQVEGRPCVLTADQFAKSLQYDHRPPLCERPYDLAAGDFMPPQNDPIYIDAILKEDHLFRTTGRNPGAEKTVTTRGSDVGERSRTRKIKSTQELHDLRMACKRGDPEAIAKLLHVERKQRPKAKIKSRGFPKRQRPMRSRKNVAA